jgi:hypothetical protein
MIKLNEEDSKKLIDKLPSGYMAMIEAELNKKKISVDKSLISKVVNGERTDHYGIIEAAIKVSQAYQAKQKKLFDKINSMPNA